MFFLVLPPVALGSLIIAIFLGFIFALYGIYRKRNPAAARSRDKSLPRYARIIPTKIGDYYDIIGGWARDETSQDMVIHAVVPDATEAKMVILKTDDGFVLRLYAPDGTLLSENRKITQFELANKFMELRTVPEIPNRTPEEPQPKGSNTVEFK